VTFVYEEHPGQGVQSTLTEESGNANIVSADELRPYPNPFEVMTSIPFVVSESSTVQVAVYDMTGREVGILLNGDFEAGRHEASWDGVDKSGKRVNPGVYVYYVRSEGRVVTGRVAVR
jgi:flagellar hook assembly protein FlgD